MYHSNPNAQLQHLCSTSNDLVGTVNQETYHTKHVNVQINQQDCFQHCLNIILNVHTTEQCDYFYVKFKLLKTDLVGSVGIFSSKWRLSIDFSGNWYAHKGLHK